MLDALGDVNLLGRDLPLVPPRAQPGEAAAGDAGRRADQGALAADRRRAALRPRRPGGRARSSTCCATCGRTGPGDGDRNPRHRDRCLHRRSGRRHVRRSDRRAGHGDDIFHAPPTPTPRVCSGSIPGQASQRLTPIDGFAAPTCRRTARPVLASPSDARTSGPSAWRAAPELGVPEPREPVACARAS